MNRFLTRAVVAMGVLSAPAGADAINRVDSKTVHEFLKTQEYAWQARDFARFYATFKPDAKIIILSRGKHGETVRSSRTLAEDRRQSAAFFASHRAPVTETDQLKRVRIGADGRSAVVTVLERTKVAEHGATKFLHASTEQKLVLQRGRIVSRRLIEDDR
jgi:hypothetical protein